MAKLKFKTFRENGDRKLLFEDGHGDTLSASIDVSASEDLFFLTLGVNSGDLVGLDRKEAIDFALAILKEAVR